MHGSTEDLRPRSVTQRVFHGSIDLIGKNRPQEPKEDVADLVDVQAGPGKEAVVGAMARPSQTQRPRSHEYPADPAPTKLPIPAFSESARRADSENAAQTAAVRRLRRIAFPTTAAAARISSRTKTRIPVERPATAAWIEIGAPSRRLRK